MDAKLLPAGPGQTIAASRVRGADALRGMRAGVSPGVHERAEGDGEAVKLLAIDLFCGLESAKAKLILRAYSTIQKLGNIIT